MAYRDYICCRDCKSRFIYDGNDNIRNSLEAIYGDENAPNWTVELVCPDCLARLERKPLTDEEIAEICMDCSLVTPSDIYFARAIEAAHGIE